MKKTTKTIVQILTGIAAVSSLFMGKALALASAEEGARAARADGMPENLFGATGVFTEITNTALYIVGIISVLMLIWGGLRYVVSGGKSEKVTDAKNTVLYAIIGLIISILSYAIVNFVLNSLDNSSKPEETSALPLTSIYG